MKSTKNQYLESHILPKNLEQVFKVTSFRFQYEYMSTSWLHQIFSLLKIACGRTSLQDSVQTKGPPSCTCEERPLE